jgi:hypothetical protein
VAAPGSPIALPKATVPLQAPSAPAAAVSPLAMPAVLPDDEVEEEEESAGKLESTLSIVALVAAVIVLGFQFVVASTWVKAPDKAPEEQGWGQLFSSSDS